jgi:hypothetical protein
MDATFFARLCFPTRPVEAVIPNYADLLQRPHDTLAGQEVRIGPAPRYGIALFATLLAPVVPLFFLRSWDWQAAGIAWAVGAAFGVLLLLAPGTSLVLRKDGVEFRERNRVVWCPWALFDAPGNPFTSEGGALSLPVAARAVPYVELRKDDLPVAHGMQIKRGTFRFPSADRVVLTGSYEIDAQALGGLLLRLGRTLGTKPLEGWAPPEAFPAEAPAAGAVAGPDGWVTLRLTNLSFPPACCLCGQPTPKTLLVIAHGPAHWLIALLSLGHVHAGYLEVSVPFCADCKAESDRRWWRTALLSTAGGLALGVLVALGLYPVLDDVGRVAVFIPACLFGPLVGGGIGVLTADWRCPPVRGARYSKRRNTVRLRFRNPEYAELVAKHLSPS